MKNFLLLLLTILYAVIGYYLEHSKTIVQPAYFALYGFSFGVILDRIRS